MSFKTILFFDQKCDILGQEIWENLRLSRKKVDHKVSDQGNSD